MKNHFKDEIYFPMNGLPLSNDVIRSCQGHCRQWLSGSCGLVQVFMLCSLGCWLGVIVLGHTATSNENDSSWPILCIFFKIKNMTSIENLNKLLTNILALDRGFV